MKHEKEITNIDEIKKLYHSPDSVWPIDDPWHFETHETINRIVYQWLNTLDIHPENKLLNAGSGVERYAVDCVMYDCDINEALLINSSHPIIASIENIPVDDNYFTYCICVGSVLNYCDAGAAIIELSRILSNRGYLILEFESSDSAEFLFTKKHRKSVISNVYSYNNTDHRLWLYSEKYIKNILHEAGMHIIKTERFHTASTLNYRLNKNQNESARYIKYDMFLKLMSKYLSHNRMLLCKKN